MACTNGLIQAALSNEYVPIQLKSTNARFIPGLTPLLALMLNYIGSEFSSFTNTSAAP